MKLALAGFAPGVCGAPAFAQPASAPADAMAKTEAKIYASSPTGEGRPNAITCRPPQTLPGKRLMGPDECGTSANWVQYRKDGMDISADGVHFQPSEKMRTINPQACHPATMGGGATMAMSQVKFSMVCE